MFSNGLIKQWNLFLDLLVGYDTLDGEDIVDVVN